MTATTHTDLAALERKVDALADRVAFLVAEAEAARRRREAWEELQATATPIGARVLEELAAELDAAGVTGDDLVALFRRLVANVATIEAAVAQLESLAELAAVLSPITARAMELAVDRLDDLDERGYLAFAKAGLGVVDRVVSGFSEEDVEALGDNVILILDTIKEMTQPELMAVVHRMLEQIRRQQAAIAAEPEEPPSLLELLRLLRDPQVRRGLRRALTTLKAVSTVEVGPPHEFLPGTEDPAPGSDEIRERATTGGA